MASVAHAEATALALWERAVGLERWARDEALLGPAAPAALGARNAALLAMRNAVFEPGWPLRSRCPGCGATVEFVADGALLARELGGMTPASAAGSVAWRGEKVELRAPTARDLSAVARCSDRREAARALLARCASLSPERIDDGAVEELGREIEALDPGALVGFALACPECGAGWEAALDLAEALWSELRLAAERALTDVDALARAYGWTEEAVLRLSPARRAAYLQLVDAG